MLSLSGQPRTCGVCWTKQKIMRRLHEDAYSAFACEKHTLGAATAHTNEAAEAERRNVRLQTKFCCVDVALIREEAKVSR
jgi:hypothetical protein